MATLRGRDAVDAFRRDSAVVLLGSKVGRNAFRHDLHSMIDSLVDVYGCGEVKEVQESNRHGRLDFCNLIRADLAEFIGPFPDRTMSTRRQLPLWK